MTNNKYNEIIEQILNRKVVLDTFKPKQHFHESKGTKKIDPKKKVLDDEFISQDYITK